ncbi:hypothetical protein ACFE04_018137 [Oxalis oulophora]
MSLGLKILLLTAVLAAVVSRILWGCQEKQEANYLSVEKEWKPELLPAVENAKGPESYDYDPNGGGPYAGYSDGRILKWVEDERRWIEFAFSSPNKEGCGGAYDHAHMENICGRPLGIRFNQSSGDLYIADAYLGLLKVGPQGGIATVIANESNGIPFKFTNGLDIDPHSRILYFTDSSSKFDRRNFFTAFLTRDSSGRLMKYDPETNKVTVLLNYLAFPNGVLLSEDGNFILVVESLKLRVLKYWIKTEKVGTVEVFVQLQGVPDNIHRSPRGGYWVALYSKKDNLVKLIQQKPIIGIIWSKLPIDPMKIFALVNKYFRKNPGVGVRLNEKGEVMEEFFDENIGPLKEIMERDDHIWVGSVDLPVATRYKI